MKVRWQHRMLIVAAVLYVVAFFLPTYAPFKPKYSDGVIFGWEVFTGGFRILLDFDWNDRDWWIFASGWLTNPLLWGAAAAMLIGQRLLCALLTLLGLLLSLAFGWWSQLMFTHHPGYWVWLSTALVLLVGCVPPWRQGGE